ncbi:MAG TPA: OmpA family protein, partial [bacterium]|nr:OmpA family protein [bacterium]
QDLCANAAEDFDHFEDEGGCPDADNDQDGIVDALDACPEKAEDLDGFEDANGCPDIDNDGDLIVDLVDKCPDQPETINGYMDEDGCPDSDIDGDGIPDERDQCPRDPETKNGYQDEDGCPDDPQLAPQENSSAGLVLQGVNFASGKADLTPESLPVLDEVANSLLLEPTAIVEIRGFTDNVGKAAANQLLSERRAEAVRRYLMQKGVAGERISAIGFGARYPLADNKTPEGRAKNRRIEFLRVK